MVGKRYNSDFDDDAKKLRIALEYEIDITVHKVMSCYNNCSCSSSSTIYDA